MVSADVSQIVPTSGDSPLPSGTGWGFEPGFAAYSSTQQVWSRSRRNKCLASVDLIANRDDYQHQGSEADHAQHKDLSRYP